MTYESPGARLLRNHAQTHPQNIVWSAETGWADETGENVMTWAEAYEQYDEMLNEAYGTVNVAGLEYDTARALRELDPIAYRTGFNDWADGEDIDIDELEGPDREGN